MTMASSRVGATRFRLPRASSSIRLGDFSVSISRRRCRVDFLLGGALPLQFFEPVAVPQQLELLPGPEQQRRSTNSAATATVFHISRLPLARRPRGRSGCSGRPFDRVFEGFSHHATPLGGAELGAPGARIPLQFVVAGLTGLLVSTCTAVLGLVQRAQRVFDDAIFERMKADHHQARAGAEAAGDRFDERSSPSSSRFTQMRRA